MKKILLILLSLFLAFGLFTCARRYQFRHNYSNANSLLHAEENLVSKPFLKAHLKDGDICILRNTWRVDTVNQFIVGDGERYDFNRSFKMKARLTIDLDSVAIFETNQKLTGPENERIASLSILAGLDIILAIYCQLNPKACFGSCPTFYMGDDRNVFHAEAEGFSNAIAPSLEVPDIDALNNERLAGRKFSIKMKNEAMETHVVRDIKLYAAARRAGQRVFHTPQNEFYLCQQPVPLKEAKADEGDCTSLLQKDDKIERYSLADPENMSSKEEIILSFDAPQLPKSGLVIGFRQTLMTTYLIYSAFGYMGDEMGSVLAEVEKRAGPKKDLGGIKRELGDIEVYLWDQKKDRWIKQGGFYETGPIAVNHQMLPFSGDLSEFGGDLKVKLVLNRGLWRIDYLALAGIIEKAEPLVLSPEEIKYYKTGGEPALSLAGDLKKPIISMPGDVRQFEFDLPEGADDYELFLYSKGYYLEWMRSTWIKEKDLGRLAQMLMIPKMYLKNEAADYKRYETVMEREFWGTRIDNKMFSYYDKK
jgi:hypothetical protein